MAAAVVGFGTALAYTSLDAGAAGTAPPAITGGQTLTSGSVLASSDGHYQASFVNGILSDRIAGGRTLWKVGASTPGAYSVLQPNGVLAIFDPAGQVIWASDEVGSGCPALDMQLDGNLVDYDTSAIWLAATAQHGMVAGDELKTGWSLYPVGSMYQLIMQTDGNLVIYNSSHKALWSSGTSGHSGARAVMQSDGNFVVYSTAGTSLWSSGTSGNRGASLAFGSDGDLVVESSAAKALWSSGSTGKAGTGPAFTLNAVNAAATPCPSSVGPPTTTVVQTQTATVTTTQTVLVPTTTVLTVATPPPVRHHRRLDVKVTTNWYYRGALTHLHQIHIAKLPRGTRVTFTYNPHRRGHRAISRGATAGPALTRLVRYVTGLTYRPGQTLNVTLTRKGYGQETATFTFRAGRLPTMRSGPAHRKPAQHHR